MDEKLQNKKYAFLLDLILPFNKKAKHRILSIIKYPVNLFSLSEDILTEILKPKEIKKFKEARYINIEEKWQKDIIANEINFTYFGEEDFPAKLLEIPDPPFAIYYKGECPNPNVPTVAMIGARQNSEYGRTMACIFAKELVKQGVAIISGMALGIDGISQREAISFGGRSYGVLGSGVDVIYPVNNRALYNSLLTNGGVISEYLPGTAPRPELFPPRNRIISGLADCILVVEAKEKSGTLITVDMALEQGREVFVIPGRCSDLLSSGCNKLIRNGATPVCTPEDLLFDMKWIEEENSKKRRKNNIQLSDNAKIIYKVLDFNWKTPDDIILALKQKGKNISMSQLMGGLVELEIKGIAQKSFGQYSVTAAGF